MDLTLKKNGRQLLGIAVVLVGGLVAYTVLKRPVEKAIRGPQRYDQTLTVGPNQTQIINFTLTGAPGRFQGQWTCGRTTREVPIGLGAKKKTTQPVGMNDILGSFSIRDPRGITVHKSEDGAMFGNFSLPVTQEGVYTLVIKNEGAMRTTPREVKVEASYTLD